jgi:hypothetical protein
MDDLTFEARVLRPLAARTAYPAAPQLRARVLAAVADAAPAPAPRLLPMRRAAIVLAAVLVLLVGVAAALALPGSRSAIADFFGIEGSRIEILPTPPPGVTPTPFPTPAGIESYATPASLDAAARAAGFTPALPARDGDPRAVYLVDYGEPPPVVLDYDRFDLWESHTVGFFGKGVPPELIIRDFTIKGQPATWISGGSHIVRFVDESGREVQASVRTVDRNTLIWRTPFAFYRLETDLPEAEAIRIAESLP